MIQPNELRIGNMVFDRTIVRKVVGMEPTWNGFLIILDDGSTKRSPSELNPIQLTSELIESCGLRPSKEGGWFNDQFDLDDEMYYCYCCV